MDRKFNLDERLIEFASAIIDVAETLPKTIAGNHIAGQFTRSGTAIETTQKNNNQINIQVKKGKVEVK